MDLTTTIKHALQDAVKSGPGRSQTRSSAVKAALADNHELITKAMAQGYSATGLAKKLKASGLSASVEMLRQAVRDIARAKPSTVSAPARTRSSSAKPARVALAENKAFDAEDRTA